jgi:hypothetical protein
MISSPQPGFFTACGRTSIPVAFWTSEASLPSTS